MICLPPQSFSKGVLLCAALALAACGSDEAVGKRGPATDATETKSGSSRYGLKVLVTRQGKTELVRVLPADFRPSPPRQPTRFMNGSPREQSVTIASNPTSTESLQGPKAPGIRPLAIVDGPGTDPIDTNEVDNDPDDPRAPGTTLALWALASCTRQAGGPFATSRVYPPNKGSYLGYYAFVLGIRSCDQGLYYQEALLCAANRLAQVADSVGTMTWTTADPNVPGSSDPPDPADDITVTVPPQATEDRFIARDIALNVLAHLARAQLITPAPIVWDDNQRTCVDAYGEVAATGIVPVGKRVFPVELFGNPRPLAHFQPNAGSSWDEMDQTQLKAVGKARLQQQAMISIAAQGLVQELTEGNFQDDLAGAEKLKSAAADPAEGIRAFWGAPTADEHTNPYNTMRHALRLLFGRLEAAEPSGGAGPWRPIPIDGPPPTTSDDHGKMSADPHCLRDSAGIVVADGIRPGVPTSGFAALQVMDALGDGFEYRFRDIPPTSPAQAQAISMLEREGILLPDLFPEQTEPQDFRDAVVAQLLRNAATSAGATYPAYGSTPQGLAIKEVMAELSDADLRFALDRVVYTFLLAAHTYLGTPDELGTPELNFQAASAGITALSAAQAPEVTALSGAVIAGGIPRRALQGDVIGNLAGAQIASDCGYDVLGGSTAAHYADRSAGEIAAFQNVFSLSEVLRRQLGVLRERARLVTDMGDLVSYVEAGLAQSADWAGGRVVHYTRDDKYRLLLTELSPAALGLSTIAEAQSMLVLVSTRNSNGFESTLFADCVAGKRTVCPAPVTTYSPDAPTILDPATTDFGLTLPAVELTFSTAPLEFEGFLVRKKNDQTGEVGQVLTFVHRVQTGSDGNFWSKASSEVISPMQRRMAEQLFGLRPLDKAQRTCASFAPTSLPGDYCIAGMKRDMFVPLANELTSEGTGKEDSWRHYLRVAEEAAAKADELGRQLIEVGLRSDERKETAAEEVGELCGAYPNVDSIQAVAGQISPPKDDGPIDECIDAEPVDIVFLGEDPYRNDPQAETKLRSAYCDTMGKPAEFKPAPFCSKPTPLTHDGLGLRTPVEPAPELTSGQCTELLKAFDPSVTPSPLDKPLFGSLVEKPWASSARLARTVNGLDLEQFANGEWVFMLDSNPTVASSSNAVALKLFEKPEAELSAAEQMMMTSFKPLVWPWCKSGGGTCTGAASFMGQILGAEDAVGLQPTVLARLEPALFTLGALAGSIPADRIRMYLPAINRLNFSGTVPLPALYGAGQFHDVAGELQLLGNGFKGVPKWDGNETMDAIAVPSGYVTVRKGTRTLPDWLSALYTQMETAPTAAAYLLVHARNTKLTFPANLPVPEGAINDEDSSREVFLHSWLQQLAEKFTGNCMGTASAGEVTSFLNFVISYSKRNKDNTTSFAQRDVCSENAFANPVFLQGSPPSLATTHLDPRVDVQNIGVCDGLGCIGGPEFVDNRFSLTSLAGQATDDCSGLFDDDDQPQCDSFDWTHAAPTNCPSLTNRWETINTGSCESYVWGGSFPEELRVRVTPVRLRPNQCSPDERLELFLDKGVANECDAMRNIVRALALSCVAENTVDIPVNGGPPPIETVGDIAKLEFWIERASHAMETVLQGTYLTGLPRSVVDAAKRDEADVDAVAKGDRGKLLLELGKSLNNIEQGMANVTSEFRRLRSAVEKAKIDIESADLTMEAADLQVALQKLEIDRQLLMQQAAKARVFTDAVLNGLGAGVSAGMVSGPAGIAVASVTTAIGIWQAGGIHETLTKDIGLLKTEKKLIEGAHGEGDDPGLNDKQHANQIRDAMRELNDAQFGIYEALEGDFTQLQNGRSDALIYLNDLRGTQSRARIALAKASGADFAALNDDQIIPLHVNTVLRRQFGVLKQRYERALAGAKRAAYLARLSIEERLGTRMSDLRESIGPIEAPALWVDELCSVQGIDYNRLRCAGTFDPETGSCSTPTTEQPAGGEELDLIKGFADQYVGDYVARLREFVEFYNLRFPFREAEDMALVSLREDLGHLEDQCIRESKNLLFFSDRLEGTPTEPEGSRGGWLATGCTQTECLRVRAGANLKVASGAMLAPPLDMGAATWLAGVVREAGPTPTPIPGQTVEPAMPIIEDGPAPPETVYQTVKLRASERYVLSWWDLARGSDGGPQTMGTPKEYWVAVMDASWSPVAYERFVPSTGTAWSDRRQLVVSSFEEGDYHVAFGVGQAGGAGASLAIANVQLELAQEISASATGYEATGSQRLVLSGSCGFDDPSDFRKRFSRRCDGTACWYELNEMFLVDTEVLNQGVSSLVGKVATGNYNYRNGEVALNVIGTGVLDCTNGNPSCYGSAYVEYDLTHHAFNVPMTDYVGDVRCFNFGAGKINSGKALAAERYLTLPIGSADSGLVEQSAFLKPEFAGRPLSGAYRLRIKDSPALVWENVDDIQILFRYDYWSRVERGPGQ